MARINIAIPRTTNTIKTNLGKILIFCEGFTEYNYFNYFSNIFKSTKYNEIEVKLENAEGNAQTVLKSANTFLANEKNKKEFCYHNIYLVFDCDDPPNIQTVVNEMLNSENGYKLLLTNWLFETWLLMHFEEVNQFIKKIQVYRKLEEHLGLINYSKFKNSEGIIRQIIGDGKNISNAIENAIKLEKIMKEKNLNISKNLKDMNPYTTMHEIMAPILDELAR